MILENYSSLVLTVMWHPFELLVPLFEKKFLDPNRKTKFLFECGRFSLSDVYKGCPPSGGAHKARVLLRSFGVNNEITILSANFQDGWNSLGYYISPELSIQVSIFAINRLDTEYPRNAFTLLWNNETVRHVSAMKDDPRWVFYEKGEIQPFEDPSLYKKRRVKDRLPPEAVIKIAENLGLDIDTEEFVLGKKEGVMFKQV